MYNDLESFATIKSPINVLSIEYYLAYMEDMFDVLSNAVILRSSDMESTVGVRVDEINDIVSQVRIRRYFSMESSVYVPFFTYLDSIAGISQHSVVDIMYKLIQAPVLILDTPIVQDTYIKQSRPTLNYGRGQSLMVGTALEGKNRSLMEIDLINYLNLTDAVVLSANLILNISGSFDPNTIIDVYPVHTPWIETNVTWQSSSFLDVGPNPIFSFTCSSSTVIIPVLNYINFLRAQEDSNFNIMFRTRDEQTVSSIPFFSKDTSIANYRPKLEIRYQAINWLGNLGDGDLDAIATIRATDSRDLATNAAVRRWAHSDLNGSMLVGRWEDKDLFSSTSILGKSELASDSLIIYSKDLDGAVKIYSDIVVEELDSSALLVYNVDIDGSVTAAPVKDLHGDAGIRVKAFIDQIAEAIITYSITLNGTARIEATKNLISDAIIQMSKTLDGDAFVLACKQLISTAKIVIKKDLDSSSNVLKNASIDSDVFVVYSQDLEGLVEVRGGMLILDSEVNIRGKITLDSGAKVVYPADYDLDGSININAAKTLYGDADIWKLKDLDGSLIIRQQSTMDMYSEASIGIWSLDLDSAATKRRSSYHDMDNDAIIIYNKDLDSDAISRRSAFIDLSGQSLNRQKAFIDLNGNAIAIYNVDLLSQAIIRQKAYVDLYPDIKIRQRANHDLLVEAIIRRLDISEIDTFAYIEGWYSTHLDGDAIVRKIRRFYLDGSATIVGAGRRWIPGVHGGDVFGNSDKKLPRLWIRELFIP